MSLLSRCAQSASLYPVTSYYLAVVVVLVAVVNDLLSLTSGLLLLALGAITVVMVTTRRELRVVHTLVNSQHDALLDRVDQLVELLEKSGVAVPDKPEPEGRHK